MGSQIKRILIVAIFFILVLTTIQEIGCKDSMNSPFICRLGEGECERNRLAFQALCELHKQLDDDNDGGVDPVEADGFARGELQYTDGFERTKSLHNEDQHISKEELWNSWKNSPAYNWTVDDVIVWLTQTIELPQYIDIFLDNQVDGPMLPRLAIHNMSYLSTVLGIKNNVHKQKILFKAMDVILFGPPKKAHNYTKDLALALSLLVAVGGCWFAIVQQRFSHQHMAKMSRDLDHLASAEKALISLQEKLEEAEKSKAKYHQEKQIIEQKYKSEIEKAKSEAVSVCSSVEDLERLQSAEQELFSLREALYRAEEELEVRTPVSPDLHHWLLLTYQTELQHANIQKATAEHQLAQARDACEKLRKRTKTLMGSLRMAHSTNLDDVDKRISEAKESLDSVRVDLQERQQRWQQIESLTGFSIITSGSSYKSASVNNKSESCLKSSTSSGFHRSQSAQSFHGVISSPSVPSSASMIFQNSSNPPLPGSAIVHHQKPGTSFAPSSNTLVRPFANRWRSKTSGIRMRPSHLPLPTLASTDEN